MKKNPNLKLMLKGKSTILKKAKCKKNVLHIIRSFNLL